MRTIIALCLLACLAACQHLPEDPAIRHKLKSNGDQLQIIYEGVGDVVQFKMLEGLALILTETEPEHFEGTLDIPQADDAIFSYSILVHEQDSTGKMIALPYHPQDSTPYFRWIGKNRDLPFNKATDLEGYLRDTLVESTFLDTTRILTLYAPPQKTAETPIVYLLDGSEVHAYAPFVDQLITEGLIKPVILVGVHASADNRYAEYVDNGIHKAAFKKHRDFFFHEVTPGIESRLGGWKGPRYIYGFSNGAAFAMSAGINHPRFFEEVIAFSTVDYITELFWEIDFKYDTYPAFYMKAGRYEDDVFAANERFAEKLMAKGIDVDFGEFISGHDHYTWQIGFLEYLVKRFGL